ncbi:MAG: hypothetical protein HQK51_20765, partial [Oligoflexia bacterium]|nr:hypothetical protein [Oligoflexia bacterium]
MFDTNDEGFANYTTSGNLAVGNVVLNVTAANGGGGTFTNATAYTLNNTAGITINISAGATLAGLVNQGTIQGTNSNAIYLNSTGTITSLSNSGTITESVGGVAGAL